MTQQLYGGLFERLNTDAEDAVSFAELGAVGGISARDAEAAFKALDADGDGRVVRSEMAPADRFAPDTINSMLIAQADATPENDRKIVADLFARADLDALSANEMDAERALRRAASLTRELGEMRAAAGVDFAAAPMTDALAARLMQQVLQGWGDPLATDVLA